MHLKRIELRGFKSFPEKTEIVFNKGITAVVGPNGSGKSNISDAVRWVLGEQSMKSLRGDKVEDVIFAGSDKKKAMNYCEAALTIDNSDGEIDLEFTEITVKRRAYRSGESEFFINGKQCRMKDIKELFLDTGVGKDSYSIIEQGKIDDILNTTGSSRRKVFDEACGISKYRYRKLEAEKNLKNTSENLERINDIYFELEKQIGPMKIQKEKAEQFVELDKNLKVLEVNSFLREIDRIEKEVKETEKQLKEKDEKISEYSRKVKLEEENLVDIDEDMRIVDSDIEKDGEYVSSLREVVNKKDAELNLIEERRNNKRNEIERKNREIQDRKNNIDINTAKIKEKEVEKTQKISDMTLSEEKIEKSGTSNKVNKEQIESIEKNIEEIKDRVIQAMNTSQEISNRLSVLETNRENMENRWQDIDNETEQIELDKKAYKKAEKISEERIQNLNKEKTDIKNKIEKNTSDIESVSSDISSINDRITKLQFERNDNQSKLDIYVDMENQYEGFKKGVKKVLKNNHLRGIDGAVAQVVKVSEKYEKAIESALGAAMQNIITEDEQSAKEAIEYLKKAEGGRVTFLPVNIIKPLRIDMDRVKSDISVEIASDIVICDEKYRNIVENLLGKTLVAKDMDDAIQFAKDTDYKFKIATLDGEIFNPGGAMTGGSIKGSTSILSRGRLIDEYKDKIEKIKTIIADEKVSREKLESDYRNLNVEKERLSENILHTEREITSGEAELSNIRNDIKRCNESIEKLERERESISSNMNYTVSKIQEIKLEADKVDNQIENDRKEDEKLSKQLIELRKKYDSQREEFEAMNRELISVKKEIESMDSEIERLDGENKETENNISRLLDEIKADEESIKILDEQKNNETKEKEKVSSMLSEAISLLENKKLSRDEMKSKYDKSSVTLKNMERELLDLREERFKVESRLERFKSGKDSYLNRLFEQYEMTFVQACDMRDDTISITKKEIESLKRKIKGLGNINLDAIEEYTSIKERFDLYSEQKSDLEDSIGSIKSLIDELETNMKSEFKIKFEEISKNFSEVYSKLFGGGKGHLSIEDKENILESDIIITAQPPGKKMKNINLLSGGEKALTAISILFAIILSRPTPFCILDEIEAPLDDINVYRFGKFLNELSERTQFIAVTHRRGTMQAAEYIYGVTMQEKGVSKIISVKLDEAEKMTDLR